ncbi:MAG TPA: hypothetical protein VGC18_11690 [Lacisediminihabitans sp.]|uniref:hypothetical protein n=1 Tax=Lacisediminihabitans sp. TaxID=2787631 RepID=UPI002ED95AD7
MIDWLSFLVVLVVSIVGACTVVFLFALGLRLVAVPGGWRRPLGVASFVVCGAAVLWAVYLVVPAFHG